MMNDEPRIRNRKLKIETADERRRYIRASTQLRGACDSTGAITPEISSRRHIGGQFLRAGTSSGANYEEARGAESRAVFIHKLGTAWKEIREALYWLRLIHRANLIEPSLLNDLIQGANELSAILAQCIRTARSNSTKKSVAGNSTTTR